jgi:hypothetical protein
MTTAKRRSMGMTAAERRLRARIGALARHSQGRTNTAPARAAFLKQLEDQVDPNRELSDAERQRRVVAARREHMSRMALKSARVRRRCR